MHFMEQQQTPQQPRQWRSCRQRCACSMWQLAVMCTTVLIQATVEQLLCSVAPALHHCIAQLHCPDAVPVAAPTLPLQETANPLFEFSLLSIKHCHFNLCMLLFVCCTLCSCSCRSRLRATVSDRCSSCGVRCIHLQSAVQQAEDMPALPVGASRES
jgi:hypothetical protein